MLNPIFFTFCFIALACAVVQAQSKSAGEQDIPSTIIAMERAALSRMDADAFLEISAPDVSYFDPTIDQPIHGLEALSAYYRKMPAPEPSKGEMTNAKVQVAGDVAVLTFNYAVTTVRTQQIERWNATEVYRQTPKGWRIIHTHWAYWKPELAKGK